MVIVFGLFDQKAGQSESMLSKEHEMQNKVVFVQIIRFGLFRAIQSYSEHRCRLIRTISWLGFC